MKKVILMLLVMLVASVALAEKDGWTVLGFGKNVYETKEGTYRSLDTFWKGLDPVMGLASYNDTVVDGTILAYYAHIPVVKYNNDFRINFGVIVPSEQADELTRPEFSVSYLWNDALGLPDWVGLETGAYYAMSPYRGYGVHLGLLRINF